MKRNEIIDRCHEEIDAWIGRAYSGGYDNGYSEAKKEVKRLRETCVRETGEKDNEYSKGWNDTGTFYGWCSQCKKPHSGRWAHIWKYCPWCGAKIDNTKDPYPLGYK